MHCKGGDQEICRMEHAQTQVVRQYVASESIHPTSVSWPHAKDISSRPTHIHVGFAGRGSE
jgi:hypothetical protein